MLSYSISSKPSLQIHCSEFNCTSSEYRVLSKSAITEQLNSSFLHYSVQNKPPRLFIYLFFFLKDFDLTRWYEKAP